MLEANLGGSKVTGSFLNPIYGREGSGSLYFLFNFYSNLCSVRLTFIWALEVSSSFVVDSLSLRYLCKFTVYFFERVWLLVIEPT